MLSFFYKCFHRYFPTSSGFFQFICLSELRHNSKGQAGQVAQKCPGHCSGSCSSGRRAVGMRAGHIRELLGHSYSCSTSKPNKGPFPFCSIVLVPQQRGVAVPNRQDRRTCSGVVGCEGRTCRALREPDAVTLLRADAAPTPEHLLELWGVSPNSNIICTHHHHLPVGTGRVTYLYLKQSLTTPESQTQQMGWS